MNDRTPDQDPDQELDARYRRASGLDPRGPGDAVRRRILDHAAALAAQRTGGTRPVAVDTHLPAANEPRWNRALLGTVAAAALAGLLITPYFLPPRAPAPPVAELPPPRGNDADVSVTAVPTGPAPNYSTPAAPGVPAAPDAPAAPPARTARAAPPAAVTPAPQPAERYAANRAAPEPFPVSPSRSAESAGAGTAVLEKSASGADTVTGARASAGAVADAAAPTAARAAAAGVPRRAAAGPGSALHAAAADGNLAQIRALVASGTRVDERDEQGRTALMIAVLRGQAGAVDVLLAQGADPDAADADGTTPLRAAAAAGQHAIAAALRRAGAH